MSNKLNIEYLNRLKDGLFKISKSVHDYDNIDELYKTMKSVTTQHSIKHISCLWLKYSYLRST